MYFPLNILQKDVTILPLLGADMGLPYIFDYTSPIFGELPVRDITYMQGWTMSTLEKSGKKWGIAGYLEDRSLRLKGTSLISEGRVYHLGIDIIAPEGVPIYSPLDGKIVESSVEEGRAAYGGFMVVEHTVHDIRFFILYGHLDPESQKKIGEIKAGEALAKIGSPLVNGEWTTHVHMQVLTEIGFEKWKNKGYCSTGDLDIISNFCPNPLFLLRY